MANYIQSHNGTYEESCKIKFARKLQDIKNQKFRAWHFFSVYTEHHVWNIYLTSFYIIPPYDKWRHQFFSSTNEHLYLKDMNQVWKEILATKIAPIMDPRRMKIYGHLFASSSMWTCGQCAMPKKNRSFVTLYY